DDNGSKSSRMGGLKGPAAVIRDVLGEVAHAANLTIKSASLTASMLAGGAASSASSSSSMVDSSGLAPDVARELEAAARLSSLDPTSLVGPELKFLTSNIKKLIESNHPVLHKVAQYYFDLEGKKVRPTIVLLMSRAYAALDAPDAGNAARRLPPADGAEPDDDAYVLPEQRRLAEITEMIHTASLVHDDVIDVADTRRAVVSVNRVFGNKMAVLGGDFLLARASLALARLRNVEVIELLSTVIANLVEGEFMQLAPPRNNASRAEVNFDNYMQKTFMKTASLIAYSSQAAAILGGHRGEPASHAFEYGRHLGLAFQLIDDYLDFVGNDSTLGKPSSADLKLGLATAPVLFAAHTYPELNELMERSFEGEGDAYRARELVWKSNGLEQTKSLALDHASHAIAAICNLPDSPAREALVNLAHKVISCCGSSDPCSVALVSITLTILITSGFTLLLSYAVGKPAFALAFGLSLLVLVSVVFVAICLGWYRHRPELKKLESTDEAVRYSLGCVGLPAVVLIGSLAIAAAVYLSLLGAMDVSANNYAAPVPAAANSSALADLASRTYFDFGVGGAAIRTEVVDRLPPLPAH
ncbi:uncharacterized protein AMSG_11778, partial [Thecamonas trahens ATCC 50062]